MELQPRLLRKKESENIDKDSQCVSDIPYQAFDERVYLNPYDIETLFGTKKTIGVPFKSRSISLKNNETGKKIYRLAVGYNRAKKNELITEGSNFAALDVFFVDKNISGIEAKKTHYLNLLMHHPKAEVQVPFWIGIIGILVGILSILPPIIGVVF